MKKASKKKAAHFKSKSVKIPKLKHAIKAELPVFGIYYLNDLSEFFKYRPMPSVLILKNQIGNQVIKNPKKYVANIFSVIRVNSDNKKYMPYLEILERIKRTLS